MKKYIHVNQHKIRANRKHGTNEPVITVKEGRKNTYCHSVQILGPSKVVYGGNDKPILSCGVITEGYPMITPMVLKSNGNWDGNIYL